MTLPLTPTRFACSDNTTGHVRKTATPDANLPKIYHHRQGMYAKSVV
ncbi:MAG: hypothetical protein OXC02_09770 [Rhodobacteraceae bacterium]|nr:hypothetical protein [Paracoccaceae bacterium]